MVAPTPQAPDAFSAIGHPARRRILDLLSESDHSVNALAGHFQMSRPAVSQHLRILLDAQLVCEQRYGRERRYRLAPQGLDPLRTWLQRYDHFWEGRLQDLRDLLQNDDPTSPPKDP